MAETLGAIRYDVEVGTANMLKAEGQVDKSIQGMVKDFDKADKAVREFTATQKSMGRTINSMGQVISKNGKIVSTATMDYRKLAATAQDGFANLNTRVNGATASMRGFGGALGNVGFQVQDIAVQAQMGVNPLIIFTQQIPQLFMGMGKTLPLIGAVVAVLGVLATTLIDTTSNMDKMEKSIERVQAVITLGTSGVAQYTEEMDRLRGISDRLAKLKLATALADQQDAIKQGVGAIGDALDETRGSFDSYQDRIENITGAQVGTDAFAQSEKAVRSFSTAVRTLTSTGGIDDVEVALDGLLNAGAANTVQGRELLRVTTDLVVKYREGEITLNALRDALEGNEEAFKETGKAAQSSFDSIIQGLVTQNVELREGERAAFALSLRLKDMTEDQVNAALAIYDNNKALESQKKKAEDDARAMKSLNDELDLMFERENIQFNRPSQEPQAVSGTIGMTDEQAEAARLERSHELLKQDLENRLITEQEYIDRRNQLYASGNSWLAESFSNLQNQAVGAFTQVLTGAQDGEDAMRSLGRAVLNEVVGSLVMQGVELVKNRILGNTLAASEQANIAATTSTGIASQQAATASTVAAAATTATAAAPAAALTSTFSFGSAAVIGAAALLSTLAIAKQAGGREFGGPVSAGNMYRVGERGPEIYTQNGKNYMIPGQNGQVISNKDIGGQQVNETYNANITVNGMTDPAFREMVVNNSKLFVDIIRQDKNSRGEKY